MVLCADFKKDSKGLKNNLRDNLKFGLFQKWSHGRVK